MQNDSPQAPQNEDQKNEQPKSLIEHFRSYQSDVAKLKGVPLKPFVHKEEFVIPVPEEKKQVSIPIRQDLARPDAQKEKEEHKYDVAGKPPASVIAQTPAYESFAAATIPVGDAPKEDPQKAIDALHKEAPMQAARTITSDLEDAAKENKTTVGNMMAAEERRAELQQKEIVDPKRAVFALGLSIILIAGGIVALGALYLVKTAPKTLPPVTVDPALVITTESSNIVVLKTDQTLFDILKHEKNQPPSAKKEIIRLLIKEGNQEASTTDSQRFAKLLSPAMPPWLVRSFKPEYLAGMYNSPKGWQPLFIFKLSSFETSYAGMLRWEETMKTDLAPLITQASAATSTATSTKSKQGFSNPIIQTGFRDVIIKNKDVRALEDSSGRRLIFYSFPNKETLVITTDQAALEEVFARLTTLQFVR